MAGPSLGQRLRGPTCGKRHPKKNGDIGLQEIDNPKEKISRVKRGRQDTGFQRLADHHPQMAER